MHTLIIDSAVSLCCARVHVVCGHIHPTLSSHPRKDHTYNKCPGTNASACRMCAAMHARVCGEKEICFGHRSLAAWSARNISSVRELINLFRSLARKAVRVESDPFRLSSVACRLERRVDMATSERPAPATMDNDSGKSGEFPALRLVKSIKN